MTHYYSRRFAGMLIVDLAVVAGAAYFFSGVVALAMLIYGFACYWYGVTMWRHGK